MSDNLKLTIRDSASGKLAIINGKTYSLLRLYRHTRMGGVFCLAVAGRTPLRYDDLDEHWRVFRSGSVYLALSARAFSYHLIQGEGSPTDAPRWPRLKTSASYFAFVGPTEEAVQTQIRLTLERYHSNANPETAIEAALKVSDECGGPPAYLLKSSEL
ncbi:MAG: hypothetical protein V3S14_06860 [Anaerolineae bacterium]